MKGWKDLFNEKMPEEYRKKVLEAASVELAETAPRRNWLAQGFKIATLTAAGAGAVILGIQSVEKKEEDQMAVHEVDPELLDNLDWLEDLDVLSHMEELTERGDS